MPTDLAYDIGFRGLSGPGKDLHTAVWHGDRVFDLPIPVEWQVTALWPPTPPRLFDRQIADCLDRPMGRDPIQFAAIGKRRPVVIVDSTAHPTPVARILPHVLRQLRQAGIEAESVRVLVATGGEGRPRPESLIKKLGPAAAACEVLIHDPDSDLTRLGTLRTGLALLVNREAIESDFRIAIEGIYPQWVGDRPMRSTLALSLLGGITLRKMGGHDDDYPQPTGNAELARAADAIEAHLPIDHTISAQVNADRDLVRLACGDPHMYYPAELTFARTTFRAPPPNGANIVVANAYPADLTLSSARRTALHPLMDAAPGASRILLASCVEGAGTAEAKTSWIHTWRFRLRQTKAALRHRHPVWLYRPGSFSEPVPEKFGEIRLAHNWQTVVESVAREQALNRFCRVHLYPCSPLQLLLRP